METQSTFPLFLFHQPAVLQTINHSQTAIPPTRRHLQPPSRYGVERGIAAAAHDLEAAHTRLALLHRAVADERRPITRVRLADCSTP